MALQRDHADVALGFRRKRRFGYGRVASPPARQIYLSYADGDRELATEVANGLKDEGFDVWFANDRLYPGDNWPLAMGKALEESDAMVVLLSPEAVRSESVQREIDYALVSLNYKNKVIPVLVRPTKDYPWILRKMQVIRAKRNLKETGKEIAKALKRSA